MKSLVLLFVIAFSFNAYAEEKEIITENNKYHMNNICSKAEKAFDPDGKYNPTEYITKQYQFEFNSKYSVFENYNNISSYRIYIYTDLYTIEPYKIKVKADNKKVIQIILEEEDMKKLYESSSVKFIFDKRLFSNEYIRKPYNRPSPATLDKLSFGERFILTEKLRIESQQLLEPVISITLNKNNFDKELDECTKKYNDFMQKYNEENSKPINRIKKFFDL